MTKTIISKLFEVLAHLTGVGLVASTLALVPSVFIAIILPFTFMQCWSIVFSILFVLGFFMENNGQKNT